MWLPVGVRGGRGDTGAEGWREVRERVEEDEGGGEGGGQEERKVRGEVRMERVGESGETGERRERATGERSLTLLQFAILYQHVVLLNMCYFSDIYATVFRFYSFHISGSSHASRQGFLSRGICMQLRSRRPQNQRLGV